MRALSLVSVLLPTASFRGRPKGRQLPAPARFEEPVTYAEPAPAAQPAMTRGVHLQPARAPAPQYVEPEPAPLPEPPRCSRW